MEKYNKYKIEDDETKDWSSYDFIQWIWSESDGIIQCMQRISQSDDYSRLDIDILKNIHRDVTYWRNVLDETVEA